MADEVKIVRLKNADTGVIVTVSEETAATLQGFEPAEAPKAPRKSAPAKSE